MKILWINHPEADYGASMLYDGVSKLLGAEDIYDYPVKWSYHGEHHCYRLSNIPEGNTGPIPWQTATPVHPDVDGGPPPNGQYDNVFRHAAYEARVVELLKEGAFDLIFMESLRDVAMEAIGRLAGVAPLPPIVVHDGEDFPQVRYERIAQLPSKPVLHLKREMMQEVFPSGQYRDNSGLLIACCPFSAPVGKIEQAWNREGGTPTKEFLDLDVCFLAGATWPIRQNVADSLRRMPDSLRKLVQIHPDSDRNFANKSMPTWEQYVTYLKHSKVGVSVRGFGWDTVRFWETAASTLLVTDETPVRMYMPNEYRNGETCIMFKTPEQCVDAVKDCLQNPERTQTLREACMKHTRTYHSTVARAKYALDLAALETRK